MHSDSEAVFGLQKDKQAPLSIPREKQHYLYSYYQLLNKSTSHFSISKKNPIY